VQAYVQELEALYNQYEGDSEKLKLLKALFDYARNLVG